MRKIKLKFPERREGERKRARGRPLKSTLTVRSEGDYAVFVFGNLSLFYVHDFSSVDYVAFFMNWIFFGRSSWARVWIFRFFGSGFCSGGILHEGREIWGIVEKKPEIHPEWTGFGVLITSVDLVFRLGLEFCSWIGLTSGDRV